MIYKIYSNQLTISLGTNAAHLLGTSNLIEYVAFSTTPWYTTNTTYA